MTADSLDFIKFISCFLQRILTRQPHLQKTEYVVATSALTKLESDVYWANVEECLVMVGLFLGLH